MDPFESGKAAANMNSLFVREVVHCEKLYANMLRLSYPCRFMYNAIQSPQELLL